MTNVVLEVLDEVQIGESGPLGAKAEHCKFRKRQVWGLNSWLVALVYLLKDIFIMSFLPGSGLTVWVLNLSLGFGLPVEGHFHNESSFWVRSRRLSFELIARFGLPVVRSCCLGVEFIDGLWSAC